MNFPAHALPAHTDVNEIDPETGIPVFLRGGSTKPAATPLDRFLNLLGITPNKGNASATVAELLIQKGRPYHAAVGFDLADDDAQRLACTLDTHYSEMSVQPLSYSAAADAALALPVATGADRTILVAGLIHMMLMASRRRRISGLINFVHQMFPSGSSVAFTTMLPGHRCINLGRIARSGSSRIRSRVSVQAPSLPG
jgi:hypothetical protein